MYVIARVCSPEYNDGLETTPPHRDTAYGAAFVFHNVPLVQSLSLFSWWTFTDVFEEGGMNPSRIQF